MVRVVRSLADRTFQLCLELVLQPVLLLPEFVELLLQPAVDRAEAGPVLLDLVLRPKYTIE